MRVTDVGQTLDVKMQLLIISQQLLELLTVISQRYVVNTLLLRSLVRLSVSRITCRSSQPISLKLVVTIGLPLGRID